MITNNTPLQYKISDWRQLTECLSNNSRDLHIEVSTFLNDDRLNGLRISVKHCEYGTLFSYVLGATGCIISRYDSDMMPELTPSQILIELAKYGFYVEYVPVNYLKGNQLKYLATISELGFDKLRLASVWNLDKAGLKVYKTHIVVFNSLNHINWLNAGYCPSLSEFNQALGDGSAVNLTGVSQTNQFDWSWLHNKVMNISDILQDNAGGLNIETND